MAIKEVLPESEIVKLEPESSPRFSPFISMRGKGEDLRMPQLPLPLRVQLQGAAGGCWEATYSAARVNTSALFRATSD